MYVVDFEIATPTDYVRSVSPSGVVSSPLISSSGMGAAGIEFGPGGAYGTNLFVADSPGGVLEVTSSGSSTSFAALNALTLAFDPSGKYGGKLYAAKDYRDGGDGIGGLRVIDSDGSVSDFGAQTLRIPVVMRFDPYGAFNNDLFLFDTDVNETYRISPTGDRQVFMSGFSLSGLAFTPDGSMYFSHSDDGTIYKVNAVVPEPGTLALVSIGALALLPRARKRARQDLHTVTLNPPHPHIFPA